ncbi:MAG: hypothetical protein GWN14_04575 [candidate division Zixibacteria bacterium]|nr:hypothetical protein [Gammaproteobacteria bacterium]NIX55212.1 hypothetical protein [candidate division Zixibacteria bacterium]
MNKEMRGSRIEKRLQREIENLYANEGLTRDLNDSSARILLELLEEQVRTIVNNTADLEDADAEEAMYPRLKAMRRMARYINQSVREDADSFDLAGKIVDQAKVLYGEAYVEQLENKIQSLLAFPRTEPGVLILTLKQLLEGEKDGEEDHLQP